MNFFQRFKRYLFGVLLGLILVFFFFGDRAELLTAWMPNERVMKRLRETKLIIPDSVNCRLNCFQLDSASVRSLFEEGNVRFGRSETQSEPKVYRVDFEQHSPPLRMTFVCDDSTSALSGIISLKGVMPCECVD